MTEMAKYRFLSLFLHVSIILVHCAYPNAIGQDRALFATRWYSILHVKLQATAYCIVIIRETLA